MPTTPTKSTIKQSTSPNKKFLIVGRKGQLGTVNHQDPDSWTYEPIGIFNHLLLMVENSGDQSLPLLEHDELDSLLNGIDWDQPLSPLDLDLPTDPDIITLLSSSSPISPVALPNQPPNPLVDKFLQSLTNAPIQFTDYPATPQQESRVNILLPSLCESRAQSTRAQ